MAICGRCGQTESAGEDCPYCSEYAAAMSPVGANSGSALRVSYGAATGHSARRLDHYVPDRDDSRFGYGQAAPEFPALPPCERPFAAGRTVWAAAPQLALGTAADLPAPADDIAMGEHEERDPGRVDSEQVAAQQQRRAALGEPVDVADDAADRLQFAQLSGHGRWIALTAAILVVLVAAAGAVTLVVQHGRVSASAGNDRSSVTARRSVSAPPSTAPAGQYQLVVDPAAAAAPHEPTVAVFLDRYFVAVNNHDFADYKRLFVRALRPGLSPASFSAGLGTSTDSSEQLHGIKLIGGSGVEASVTFISRQPTFGGRRSLMCTAWRGTVSLGWRGTRYLLVAAPTWYQAPAGTCS